MTIDVRIADAKRGFNATVVHPEAALKAGDVEEHALCVNISGISNSDTFSVPVSTGVGGTPYEVYFLNSGSSALNVNGSVTPVTFSVAPHPTRDFLISEISFVAYDGGIKSQNFLGTGSALTNGVLIEGKATNVNILGNVIKRTAQLVEFSTLHFWNIFSDASADTLKVSNNTPFVLKRQGFYGASGDDYLRIKIRDNITAVDYFVCYVRGVLR